MEYFAPDEKQTISLFQITVKAKIITNSKVLLTGSSEAVESTNPSRKSVEENGKAAISANMNGKSRQ